VIDGHDVDFRVSTFPTVNGEKVVMRILDKTKGLLTLEEIGLRPIPLKLVSEAITKSHGMTLVTGPTGSGKTTTLYSILSELHQEGVNIVTLEDPVEYRILGINQSQVNPEINYSFATGLRSILRQDPNIIMVGEIRDLESAELAVQAALTGHVVLSTLHTNSAAGAIPRLVDMGIQPFLIASSVNTIVAQRLARRLCERCKKIAKVDRANLQQIDQLIKNLPSHERAAAKHQATFFQAHGCDECNKTGFKGRIGIYEILPMSDQLKTLDLAKATAEEIELVARRAGMTTMQQDGMIKASLGLTTVEEIWRVSKE
jgi:type II secretory ATPase GspE/PulE/Tfp pilus assembly ATPase PilB-like protein